MLSPKPPLSAQHPDVRINEATRQQFARKCEKVGVSTYAGAKQLIEAFLAKPFKLHPVKRGELCDAKIPGVRDTPAHVQALKAKATAAGITHGEAIRQIIHHYIDRGAK